MSFGLEKKNKGVALVSVLIGVMFITILATTLLYAATMNYNMKIMRHNATDNFYTTEFALDEITADVSAMVTNASDPIKKVEDELKVTAGNYTVYDVTKLNNMITVANQTPGVESISVNCIYKDGASYTQDTFVKDTAHSKIILRGVQVTTTLDDEHGNYVSSITTDIEFRFPQAYKSSEGLKDFSILTNGSYNIMDITQVIAGNLYLKDAGKGYGMYVHDSGVVYVLGGFSYVDGNVNLSKGTSGVGGIMYVGGNMYIDGDLNVGDGCTIYVLGPGKIYVRGKVTMNGSNPSGDTKIISDNWTYTADTKTNDSSFKKSQAGTGVNTGYNWKLVETDYPDGLTPKMFANSVSIRKLGDSGEVTDYPVADFIKARADGNFKTSGGLTTVNFGGTLGNVSNYWYQVDADGYSYSNSLVFGLGTIALNNAKFANSTYVNLMSQSGGEIEMSTGSNVDNYFGSMTQEAYDAAKSIFYAGNVGGSNGTMGAAAAVLATEDDVYTKAELAEKGITVPDGIFRIYAHKPNADSLTNAEWQARTDYDEVISYTSTTGHTMYCSKNVTTAANIQDVHYYISGDAILNPSADQELAKFMSNGGAGTPAGSPCVAFANWIKE
ncbi:MAG: hypothetical protein IKO10_05685 [Lachnospiraceae bacterium]|nr:hypothetical protein [Lachnospiraceae bacterium]